MEETNFNLLYLVLLGLVLGILFILMKKKSNIQNQSANIENVDENKVNEKINEIKEAFMFQAIGFYLQEQAFKLNLDKKGKEELFQKSGYKEEFSSPIIEWSKEFDFMSSGVNGRDDLIKRYLISQAGKGFCQENEFVLNCFERYLLIQAEAKAKQLSEI